MMSHRSNQPAKIKSMPGVRGKPTIIELGWDSEHGYVEQGRISGPYRSRRRDAIRAWNKLVDDITKAVKEQE